MIEKVKEEGARRGETKCGGQYGSSEADKLCPEVRIVGRCYGSTLQVVSSLRRRVGEMSDMIMLVTILEPGLADVDTKNASKPPAVVGTAKFENLL